MMFLAQIRECPEGPGIPLTYRAAQTFIPAMKRILLAMALCGSMAQADSVTYFPVADTTISQNEYVAENAFLPADGTSDSMIVGRLSVGVPVRGFLRFDITNLPPNVVVTSVTLSVTTTRNAFGAGTEAHLLHRSLLWWDENLVTWANTGWEPWENAGGDFDPTADASVLVSGVGTYIFASTPALVSTVQLWATNAASNFGWMLRSAGEEEGHNARRFTTRENAGSPPSLVVGYTVATPPPEPVTLSNPRVFNNNFVFDFTALPGTSYRVQYKTALEPGEWTTLETHPSPGGETVITVQDPLSPSNRFYRVVSP
jgi:hypothetical protein